MTRGIPQKVVYAENENGRTPAREFLSSIEKKKCSKFHALFDRLRTYGWLSATHFKKLHGDSELWEFIVKPYRIFCFQIGSNWYLTNGFRKQSNETPIGPINQGVLIRRRYI